MISPVHSPTFDALAQPLHGLHGIEASAGTGKTYTITLLWLRLICEDELPVESILVSTFTRAATAELRERLRQGLLDTLAAIEQPTGKHGDVGRMVQALLAGRPAPSPDALRHRVRRALSDFDLAPISTIHGFCSALIARHCLELGADPDATLVENSTATLERMVVDELIRAATETSESVADCLSVANSIAQEAAIPDERLDLPAVLGSGDAAAWTSAQETVAATATSALPRITPNQTREKAAKLARLISQYQSVSPETAGALGKAWFTDKQEGAIAAQAPEFLAACEKSRQAANDIKNNLWRRLVARVRHDYPAAKARKSERTFDDLLLAVLQALQSDHGRELARSVRQRFQAVMVDECQDSDAVQIEVFRSLFAGDQPGHTAEPTRCFLVIGDPKQSIYRFRGADLASYRSLSALAIPAAAMATNWRSDAPLVQAIDQIYQDHHTVFTDSASSEAIPYVPVMASPEHTEPRINDPWLEAHPSQPTAQQRALVGLWSHNDKGRPAKADLAAQCAAECQRLLNQGVKILDRHSKAWRAMQADDIAIIAGTRGDLNMVRRALNMRGIPSQFAGRGLGSVLASDEARDVQIWLDCLAASETGGSDLLNHLSALFATPLYAGSASACQALAADPAQQALLAESCRRQAAAVQRQGPLPVLLRLINDPTRLGRCLAAQGGERLITNWRHVADLLQAQWAERAHAQRSAAGCSEALLLLMAEAQQNPDHSVERLETDLSAIQLVTTHGSKGLEYPITFCPFLWHQKSRSRRRSGMRVAIARAADGAQIAVTGAASFADLQGTAMAQQDEEEQRLLYVALTRARHRCYVGLAGIPDSRGGHENGAKRSALARLLALQETDEAEWLSTAGKNIFVLNPPEESDETLPDADDGAATPAPDLDVVMPNKLHLAGYVPPRISSFSGISNARSFEVVQDRDEDDEPPLRNHPGLLDGCGSGVELGNRVHNLLEAVIGNRADLDSVLPVIEGGLDPERAQANNLLRHAIQVILDTPLQLGAEKTPASLLARREQAFAEMHFLLPVHDLKPNDLATALLADPAISGDPARCAWAEHIGLWSFQRLQGFLQGFIDLTLRDQDGRWWVLDYKTNQLPAYDIEHCEQSMLHSHYLLQGRLYLVALHRHLRHHLPDYDPALHLGGCAYAYVRGFNPAQLGQGLWQEMVQPSAVLALDTCFSNQPATPRGVPA